MYSEYVYGNVASISNQNIYNYAHHDMTRDNAILVSSKDRYINYVNWFTKNYPNEDLNVRLSPKKLVTKSGREQYHLLLRRYHPWISEINIFILRMEQSGIFVAWGDPTLNLDVRINPKFVKATKNIDEKSLHFVALIPMLLLLLIGLASSLIFFALENCYNHTVHKICIPKDKYVTLCNWTMGHISSIIVLTTLTWFYFHQETFPVALAFVRSIHRRGDMYFLSLMGMSVDGQFEYKGSQVMYK